jgi:hypothetical protein
MEYNRFLADLARPGKKGEHHHMGIERSSHRRHIYSREVRS